MNIDQSQMHFYSTFKTVDQCCTKHRQKQTNKANRAGSKNRNILSTQAEYSIKSMSKAKASDSTTMRVHSSSLDMIKSQRKVGFELCFELLSRGGRSDLSLFHKIGSATKKKASAVLGHP